MKRSIRALLSVSALIALAAVIPAGNASGADAKNVWRWVSAARKVGSAPDNARVDLVFYLGFKNLPALQDLVKAQYTHGDRLYGRYLTPDEFRRRFAPDVANVALVRDTVQSMGFTIDSIPKSGFFVRASGTVGQAKAALGVSQDLYSYEGKVLRANAETPKLPARIASLVTHISGLDDSAALRHPYHRGVDDQDVAKAAPIAPDRGRIGIPNATPPTPPSPPSVACSSYFGDHSATLSTAAGPYGNELPYLVCGYTPQQMQQAYGVNTVTQTGAGVRVGIVDAFASPTILRDSNTYFKNHQWPRLNRDNFSQIIPTGIYKVPANNVCDPQTWYQEESLDVQAVHSIAPGAFIVYLGGADCAAGLDTAFYNAIDDHVADILSNSYGYGGETLPPDQIAADTQAHMQAAAEGITLLFSTGDDGNLAAANGIASGSWPATSPYVTAVGGTSLALYNSDGAKDEWGWGSYRAFLARAAVSTDTTRIRTTGLEPFAFYSGAGGGPSLFELQPDYQTSLPYDLASTTTLPNGRVVPLGPPRRLTPDIAMDADPYTGFLRGETFTVSGDPTLDSQCTPLTAATEYCEIDIGGTSLASPLFAGVLALVNQARFANNMPAVGYVNPTLYSLHTGSADGLWTQPIIDVVAPSSPTAVLRTYLGNPNEVRVVAINSATTPKGRVSEGIDTSYKTNVGWDEVTGLGWPNVPELIPALSTPTP
jgi:subtilase family serine protease